MPSVTDVRGRVSLLSFLLLAACGGSGPRLEVSETFHDFGTVAVGSVARHVFGLRNAGGEDLVLRSVRGSCGCAVLDLVATPESGLERRGDLSGHREALVLAPGERGELRVLLDPARAPGGPPEGVWSILFETNEPDRTHLRLEYHARFDVPFNVSPPGVTIPAMGPQERVERTVILTPTGGRDLTVFPPETVPEGLEVSLERDVAFPIPRYLLRIVLGPGLPPEKLFSTHLVLRTDYAEGHTLPVAIQARVTGALAVHPAAFEILVPPEGTAGSTVVLRDTRPDGRLAIREVRVEGEAAAHLRTSLEVVEEGRVFEIRLESASDIERAPFRGVVVVATDDSERPEVRIPYRGAPRS